MTTLTVINESTSERTFLSGPSSLNKRLREVLKSFVLAGGAPNIPAIGPPRGPAAPGRCVLMPPPLDLTEKAQSLYRSRKYS
ncbi:unannotated protein [freshwater metagenome]|uniref:Unannotated protein n=1 Tax=freshwater metagenome TaxID=449393 RepID=A0A6J7QA71_9ZZZZ